MAETENYLAAEDVFVTIQVTRATDSERSTEPANNT